MSSAWRYDGRSGQMLCKGTESQQGVRSIIVSPTLDGECLEDRVISPEPHKVVLVHLFESVIRRYVTLSPLFDFFPLWITLYLHDLCITWTSLSPHLDLLQSPSFGLSVRVVSSVSCLVRLFLRIRSLHHYLPTRLSIQLNQLMIFCFNKSLKSSHSFLLSAFRSCSVCMRVSETQVRESPHFIWFILRGTWPSELFQGLQMSDSFDTSVKVNKGWCISLFVSDPCASSGGLIRPEGTYFPDSDGRSTHYPTYYTVTFQHERKLDPVSFYSLFVTVQSVFQQRNIIHQTDTVSLLPLHCFPLFFFSWPVTTTQPFAKSWNITKIFKLMWNSSIPVD